MANRSKQKSQRRMQIVMAVFAILVVCSMLASTVSIFVQPVTPTTNTQPQTQPTTIFTTPAP
jgi:hypothetical protein